MVDKIDVPAEEGVQETQEHRDAMEAKVDANNTVEVEQAPEAVESKPILGKFKTQEDLVKSYQELEKKLGESKPQEEAPKEESKTDTQISFDFTSAQREFEDNGELSEETISGLEKAGLPKSYIDNYIAGLDAVAKQFETQAYESAGGEENYKRMTDWVSNNLSESEVKQFNDNISKDNETALFTIKGMYARFSSESKEPMLTTGETSVPNSGATYESIGQMKADMASPQYATDSAFRKMVADKLARSKVI